jgi:circadian clock protein KaiB
MSMAAASFRLRLYIALGAPNSVAAEANLRGILQRLGELNAEIEIVDVLKDPIRALDDRILVSPTLVRLSPEPGVVLIGNLSDADIVEKMLKRPA